MSLTKLVKNNWFLFVLLLLFLIAGGVLRLFNVNFTGSFVNDSVRDCDQVRKIIQKKKLTLLGPPMSVGAKDVGLGTVYFGPVYYYLLIVPLFLANFNPIGPVYFIALLNTLSILVIFILGLEIFNKKISSLATAALLALSLDHILYSRSIWNPNLLVFFSSFSLLFLYITLKNQKKSFSFLLGVLLGITTQLHYTAAFLLIFSVIKFISDVKTRKKVFWVIGGIFLAFLPLIVFELRHGFLNIRSLFFIFTNSLGSERFGFSLNNLLLLLSKLNHFLAIKWSFCFLLPVLFLIATRKNKKIKIFYFLFIFGLLFLSFINFKGVMTERYLLSLLPAYYLLMGAFIDFVFLSKRQPYRLVGYFLFTILLFLNVFNIGNNFNKFNTTSEKSLAFFEKNASLAVDDFRKNNFNQAKKMNIVNLSSLDRRGTSFRYFFAKEGLPLMSTNNYSEADILYIFDNEYGWEGIKNNTDTWELSSFKPRKLDKIIFGFQGIKIYKITKDE